jgi:PAS domain S-box-containing protein
MTRRGHRIPVEIVFNYLEFKEKQYCCCFATDITERKEAEEALRESEERYRLVVENSHDVVVIYRENRFFYFNDRASEITGYTRDELNKMDIWNLILADDRTKMQEYGRKRIQGVPVPAVYTARLLTKEGEIRYADFTVERIILKGEPAILAMIKDITDRKHAEEAFRESRQILEAVLNSITVRVFWKDKNSVYLGCNTAFARDAGFIESADIIGKDDYAMSWYDQAERYRDDDRSVIASGSSKLLFEEPLTTPSGEIIQVLTSKVPLRDAGGEIIGVLGTYLDITDRKRAEVALHEASLYSRNLIEVNLDPLVTISADGRITDVNAATERVTGYPREFLIGTDFSDYFTDPEKARAGYRKVFEEGAVRDYLLEIKNRDGRIRQVLYNATIYRDESGTVKGVFAAARDITERTQAEEKNTKTGANSP